MPGGFPLGLELCNGTSGPVNSNSGGTQVDPGASANTKGSYVTLIASTTVDACWAEVGLIDESSDHFVADISVGAAGVEVVVANNLMMQSGPVNRCSGHYSFPVSIPAGSRVSARTQSAGGSADNASLFVQITLYDGAFTQMEGSAGVDSPAINLSTTHVPTITSNVTPRVKGSYTQLVASTSRDYMGVMVSIGNSSPTSIAGSNSNFAVDIAIGASGSEKIIIPDITFSYVASQQNYSPTVLAPLFIQIPSGTAISARCADDTGGTSIDVGVWCIYQ